MYYDDAFWRLFQKAFTMTVDDTNPQVKGTNVVCLDIFIPSYELMGNCLQRTGHVISVGRQLTDRTNLRRPVHFLLLLHLPQQRGK